MNRYPITSARIRPLQERPGPFLSDANRDVLRKELIGPTTAERAANRQARIGQIADPTAVGAYINSGRATGGRVNPTAENQGDIFTTNWVYDPESGTRRQAQGWFAPWEIEDNQGNPVYDESSPEWQKAAQLRLEVRANNQVAQNRQIEQDYQREVVPSQTANRLAAGLQTAGFEFTPGYLNDAANRESLYNSRGNLGGFVNANPNSVRQGGFNPYLLQNQGLWSGRDDPMGVQERARQAHAASLREEGTYSSPMEAEVDGGYDYRQRRYAGATAGPGGVVQENISYPQLPQMRPPGYGRPGDPDYDAWEIRRQDRERTHPGTTAPSSYLPRDPSEEGPFSTGGEYRYLSGRGPRASLSNYSARIRPRY